MPARTIGTDRKSIIAELRVFLARQFGLDYPTLKDSFLLSRMDYICQEMNLSPDNFRESIQDPSDQLLDLMRDCFTVNETYFFRDYALLEVFANIILNPYAAAKPAKNLRFWSAACSTGEEAYTLSIILDECLELRKDYVIDIIATDLSQDAVAHAKRGVYGHRSVKDVPEVYLSRYFKAHDGQMKIKKERLTSIYWGLANLVRPAEFSQFGSFDFIFCRNVLIYFPEKTRQVIIESLVKRIVPGGYLFLGHSETIPAKACGLQPVHINNMSVYRKPND